MFHKQDKNFSPILRDLTLSWFAIFTLAARGSAAMLGSENILLHMNMWMERSGLEKYINLARWFLLAHLLCAFRCYRFVHSRVQAGRKMKRRDEHYRAHQMIIKIHDTYIYMIKCQYRQIWWRKKKAKLSGHFSHSSALLMGWCFTATSMGSDCLSSE